MILKRKNKVVIGLSGGIDSSVALFLLKEQGYQPIGVSLKFSVWPSKKNLCLPRRSCEAKAGRENLCCTNESFNLAKKLCQKLGVPYYIIDCQKEFEKIVIKNFVSELKAGHTPNPCVVCNQKLRFPKLFELAKNLGADYVSTGHYARLCPSDSKNPNTSESHEAIRKTQKYHQGYMFGSFARDSGYSGRVLLTAKDKNKDQSYFLYTLNQRQLSRLIFPLGDLYKEEVRKIAEKEKIFYTKRESQDFCFVANQSLVGFLRLEIGENPGQIYDTKGNLLGNHRGLHFYTIGQRKGLNLGKRYWVCSLDKKRNTLIVTDNENDLLKKELIVRNVNWISGKKAKLPITIKAKVRYRQEPATAIINYHQSSNVYSLKFKVAQRAITPGQSCVFYKGGVCLGGGVIENLKFKV